MKENIRRLMMAEPEMRRQRDSRGRYMGMEDYSGRNGRQIGYGQSDRYDIGYDRMAYEGGNYDIYDGYTSDRYTGGGRYNNNGRSKMTMGSTHAGQQMDMGMASVEEYLEEPITIGEAMRWAENLEGGAHFKTDEVKQIAEQMGIPANGDKFAEFYAVTNALYSDYNKVMKTYGLDDVQLYAKLAKAWIHDKDAVENKSAVYYRFIVEE